MLDDLPLASDCGIDYTPLRDLLAAGEWKEADRQTRILVLQAANCTAKGYLNSDDWLEFSITDLNTIDKLWVQSSSGHFGFSVQKSIWESIGGHRDAGRDTERRFGDLVDWRRQGSWLDEKDLVFDLKSQRGHLPCDAICHYSIGSLRWWVHTISALAERIVIYPL
ncbi:MAG TPA: GUN4 domain-containing protein [Oscillatoriaceae cyanobacterium M33_DOE_052]|uniref:GUN4 domain-containing protein n=1 Tax=Planktothricoides sp. SpSt-374 TaxID=2282167 RepID=A0A7C3VJP5_9CYAN|nr:GUN4 domain-containing protein [Oscillatoriaceae cyanobacterium M33_DOE_052]